MLLTGECLECVFLGLQLLELVVHRGDLPLIELDLLFLGAHLTARADNAADVVGVEECEPDHKNKGHDKVLAEDDVEHRVFPEFVVFLPYFRQKRHLTAIFHKINYYFY